MYIFHTSIEQFGVFIILSRITVAISLEKKNVKRIYFMKIKNKNFIERRHKKIIIIREVNLDSGNIISHVLRKGRVHQLQNWFNDRTWKIALCSRGQFIWFDDADVHMLMMMMLNILIKKKTNCDFNRKSLFLQIMHKSIFVVLLNFPQFLQDTHIHSLNSNENV